MIAQVGMLGELLSNLSTLEKVLSIVASLIAIIGTITGIITWVAKKRAEKKKSSVFRYVSRANLSPTDIMHDRGEVVNGFDANIYFPRNEVDDAIEKFLRESSKTSNLLVVAGLLSSGKSRAVYESIKKSDLKTVALCYDAEKEENYEWSLDQWKKAIEKLKQKDCVLCIDSISDLRFASTSEKKENEDEDSRLENWKKLLQMIHSRKLRCIVTLATPSQETAQSFAKDFLELCNTDEFKGEGNGSATIRVVEIPEITKKDELYKKCKSLLPGDYYSPVVGDYLNYRYCDSVWKRFEKSNQAVRLFVALMLTLKYSQYSHNVVPSSYLKKVYFRMAQDGNVSTENLEQDFAEAYTLLESLKLIRMSESKAVCVIRGENSFEYIKECLFKLLDEYHERKLKDASAKAKGIVALIEPYIRRNDNLYIEKKQADLLISIDPNYPGLYKDAVVFTNAKNRVIVADIVRAKFDAQFFTLDGEGKTLHLKSEYQDQMEDLCDTIGVLISRSCRTYNGLNEILTNYLKAGVEINEDIICELLRIATEEDITTADKDRIKNYAFALANEKFGRETVDGVTVLLSQSPRFNTSYESISDDYNPERIKQGFCLQADNFHATFERVKEAFSTNQENQLEEDSGKTYQKLWSDASKSLFHYCRKLTERLRSKSDLEALLAILSSNEIRSRCREIDNELRYINMHSAERSFVFMNGSALVCVAKAVLAYNPMGYIGECRDMTVLLYQNLNDPKYTYAFNAQSIFYLVGLRDTGVMGVIPDFGNAAAFYTQLRDTLKEIDSHEIEIEKALNLWLYPLFDKIKREEHLEIARKLILSPDEMEKLRKERGETIVGNRKLVNALIYNAPSYELANQIYEEYETIVSKRIDTINILLGHIKNGVGRRISEREKKEYSKLTIKWIDVIQSLEWNKFSTDAGRANSVLTSIATSLRDTKLEEKIKGLELPNANVLQRSRLTGRLNAIKNGTIDSVAMLRNICQYYNSAQGEDIYEDSDYLTHVIKYACEKGLPQRDMDVLRAMINGDDYRLPVDELISPKKDFYKQVLYKVLPKEEYGFDTRWDYIKYAYLRLYTCDALPVQGDKQLDLLFKVLRTTAYERPNDAIERMRTDIYDFVKKHPVFITMYMSTICKLADHYASTIQNLKDPKIYQEKILPELDDEIKRKSPVPQTEEEIKNAIRGVIKSKLERINKLLMTLEIEGKPLPFDDRFTISISKTNEKITKEIGPWFVKGPFNTYDDSTRHNAWDCYVEGKTNLNYKDLLPKIIYSEVQRICNVMAGLSPGTWKNFEYLKRELALLREKCTPEEYKELAFAGVDKAYTNFKHAYPDQTTDWADDVYAQFSILCTTKESLDEWNALHL